MSFNSYHNSRLTKLNPCYTCERRFMGCHSDCKEYLVYKSKLDNINAKKGEYADVNAYIKSNAKKRVHSEGLFKKQRAER
ncbi:hypothetical protein [Peptostreptococcus equinus]|uniref:Uncharacterized protein n=1 Tax=Peptostreptococcus equinus TaxID=3003601 RepID=A0ABY7JU66_9FIRM|nr:hypothetical protein [Peptostreptococcus sp. CBA3647]WAW14627.1 hypothetical protein O0R46_08490 [Peptostreptococcus sp. CBA3647]WAW15262.1 hypothetical protein O0R46_02085 [Peptostreptococcus sp. CBA3647]